MNTNLRSSDPLESYKSTMVSVVRNQIDSLKRRRFSKMEEMVAKYMESSETSSLPPEDINNNNSFTEKSVQKAPSNCSVCYSIPEELRIFGFCDNRGQGQDEGVDDDKGRDHNNDPSPRQRLHSHTLKCYLIYASFVALIYIRPDILFQELVNEFSTVLENSQSLYVPSDKFGPVV